MAVEAVSGPVVSHGGSGVSVRGGFSDVAGWHTGVHAAVMNEWRRLWGEIRLVIPARRARRLTVRSPA